MAALIGFLSVAMVAIIFTFCYMMFKEADNRSKNSSSEIKDLKQQIQELSQQLSEFKRERDGDEIDKCLKK